MYNRSLLVCTVLVALGSTACTRPPETPVARPTLVINTPTPPPGPFPGSHAIPINPGFPTAIIHETFAPSPGLAADALPDRASMVAKKNPIPGKNVAQGGKLYEQHCVECHGDHGLGDGAGGRRLSPHPTNLVTGHFRLGASDSDVFATVMTGVPTTRMRPWFGRLSEPQVWAVVNYLGTLRRR